MIGKGLSFIQKFLNKKDRRQETIADFHTTIIRVDENFISSASINLDEVLVGNIYSLKGVFITDTGEISGNVTSRTASVSGRIYGDLISTEYAEIKSTAVISGNIRAKAISIERGAVINGSVRIEGNIDERDLFEKVESRIPSHTLKEPGFITYILPEETSAKESAAKAEMRPSESGKRTPAVAKSKPVKPVEAEPEKAAAPTSWY